MNLQTALNIADELTQTHTHTTSLCPIETPYHSNQGHDKPFQDPTTLYEYLKTRIGQGGGEACIEIGIQEDGTSLKLSSTDFEECLANMQKCAEKLNADATLLYTRNKLLPQTSIQPLQSPVCSSVQEESGYTYGHVLIRKRASDVSDVLELRVCVVGNVDAGKSTLLGVLTKGVLDDGRGKARVSLFKHKHEIETGRTSSIGMELMGFDSKGNAVTPDLVGKSKLAWDDVCSHSSKLITFIDLAGHEKYLKTTVFGMTGNAPDFVQLIVGSNAGIIGMTKEHLGLALALQVPVYIVVTKIDMCPKNILESTLKQLVKILRSSGCRKVPIFINSIEDILMAADNFVSQRVCPIFQVSNVSGIGLDLLRNFLNVAQSNNIEKYDANQPLEFQITDTFSIPGVGTVVSGTVMTGMVHVGDSLLLGPDQSGKFITTQVKSIQRKRVNVLYATAGQSVSFALKKVKKSCIRKGMIMASKSLEPKAIYEFEAEILVLYHSTTIHEKYQAMLHAGCVRQTASIVSMDKKYIRTGDRSIVRFRFLQHPEYLRVGTRLLFREGRTKGVGKVVALC